MTKSQLFKQHFEYANPNRLSHISRVLSRLKIAKRGEELTPYSTGLIIWIIAICPYANADDIEHWLLAQFERMNEARKQYGINPPGHVLGDLLLNYQKCIRIQDVCFETKSGAIFLRTKNKGYKMISPYAIVDSNQIASWRALLEIPARTFMTIAEELKREKWLKHNNRQEVAENELSKLKA